MTQEEANKNFDNEKQVENNEEDILNLEVINEILEDDNKSERNDDEQQINDILEKYQNKENDENKENDDEDFICNKEYKFINNSNDNTNKKSNLNIKKKINKDLRKKFEENISKFFFNNSIKKEKDHNNIDEEDKELENLFVFSKLKKLKKKSEVEKEKKILKKASMGFFDVEAELGSDNEEHDDMIKQFQDSDEEGDDENDQDLKDLIVADDILLEEGDTNYQKYFDDMLNRDKEEIRKVINGPDKILKIKRNRSTDEIGDEDLPLQLRMQKYIKNKDEVDDPEFDVKNLFKRFKSIQEKMNKEDEEENEESNEMFHSIQNNLIKKLADKDKNHRKILISRLKENEKILENVINLNGETNDKEKEDCINSNKLFIRGSETNIKNESIIIPVGVPNINNKKFGSFYNHKNSFLHAIKNDKYYPKPENSLNEMNSGNSTSITPQSSFEKDTNINKKNSNYSIFSNKSNSNNSINSNKSSNLSALFTGGNIKNRHKDSTIISRQNNNNLNITPIKEKGNSMTLKRLLNS